jgi:hypothetical protein
LEFSHRLYRPQTSAGVVALVRALEGMIEAERKRLEAEAAAFLSKTRTRNCLGT